MRFILTRSFATIYRAIILMVLTIIPGAAEPVYGQPVPYQLGFQAPVTPVMERIQSLHDFLLVIMALICLLVVLLLIWCCVRYRASANSVPSKTSHNTPLEIIWTIIPCFILLAITFPSLALIYDQHTIPPPDLTIKVSGNQWYWSYEYVDADMGGIAFDSFMIEDDDLKPDQPRLLATDFPVIVPVNKTVELLIISNDVLHSWTVPAFGLKMDAVPGQLAHSWFRAEKTGIYYGQCSELCGSRHAFMPIEVHVVSDEQFAAWVKQAKIDLAAAPSSPLSPPADRSSFVTAADALSLSQPQ